MKNYDLIRDNVKFGTRMETPWRTRLKKKYPSICNKNITDNFASMDSISNDNGVIIEHEHKKRNIKHDKYFSLFFNKCKFDKSVKQIQRGIRQIYYWTCDDGLFYWEMYDIEKQKHEFQFGRNGNFHGTGQGARDIVNIKIEHIKKYED